VPQDRQAYILPSRGREASGKRLIPTSSGLYH